MKPLAGAGLLAAALAAASSARGAPADQQAIRLDYDRGDVATCPDERGMQDRIAATLGYAPFDPQATREVDVRIRREGAGLSATVVFRSSGVASSPRHFSSTAGDCSELAATVALTIGIAIDPASVSRATKSAPEGAAEPAAAKAPPSLPPAPAPAPVGVTAGGEAGDRPAVRPRREPAPLHLRVGVKALAALGLTPSSSFASAFFIGGAMGAFSVDVEGRYHFASSAETNGGRVLASLALGLVVPCVHVGVLAACAVAGGGAMSGEGRGTIVTTTESSAYAVAGARAALELPLGGAIAAHLSLEGLAPLVSTTLRLRGLDVWRSSPIGVTFGAGVLARFP